MRKLLKIMALGVVMMPVLASTASAGQFSVGIQIGTPPPPPPVVRYAPPAPAPGYLWVQGYYYPVAGRYAWRNGYWAQPPYPGAYWVAPRYHGARYYGGYWAAPHGYHGSSGRASRYYYRR